MKNNLFIIGNGFDLAYHITSKFDSDLKNDAKSHGQDIFWDLYQKKKDNIWQFH